MISNLEEIKIKADILSVVEHYLPLRKSNGSYLALCPFHTENTPSFVVSPSKNMFHCFGCGAGGDSFSFVQKYKHCEFNEAVKEVANICNLVVQEQQSKAQISKNALFEVLENVNVFLKENLKKDKKTLEYLKARGLSFEDIEKFDIGLWSSANELARFLTGLKQLKIALNLGVLYQNKQGGFKSLLENRLNFTIRNYAHKVVGFSGRLLAGGEAGSAKYINSKESELYKKSFILYNLSNAKASIAKLKEVIICEGYFDAIACVKLGFLNAVATCGTAFALSHLALLLKMCPELSFILCFDKDSAGVSANLRALKMLFKEGIFKVKVRYLKAKKLKDFGDLLTQKDFNLQEAYTDLDGFEYFCKMSIKDADNDKKFAFFKELKTLINAQSNFYLKQELKHKAAGFLACNVSDFEEKEQVKEGLRSDFLERVVLKNILEDENKAFLARQYLKDFHFKALREHFKAFLAGNNEFNLSISLDTSLKSLSREDFAACLKELVKSELLERLEGAKRAKNVSLIVELNAKIATI